MLPSDDRRLLTEVRSVLLPLAGLILHLDAKIADQLGAPAMWEVLAALDEADAALHDGTPGADWSAFLATHPELTAPPKTPAFTDEDVLRALADALAHRPAHGLGGAVWAAHVARGLFGDEYHGCHSRGMTGAVAQRLRRLTAAGKVVRLRPRYGGGACGWSLPGHHLAPQLLRRYRVEAGDDG